MLQLEMVIYIDRGTGNTEGGGRFKRQTMEEKLSLQYVRHNLNAAHNIVTCLIK